MSDALRAIYRNGQIELLEPANLEEGQVLNVIALSARDLVMQALGDLAVQQKELDQTPLSHLDDEKLRAIIREGITGEIDLSLAILEERQTGP